MAGRTANDGIRTANDYGDPSAVNRAYEAGTREFTGRVAPRLQNISTPMLHINRHERGGGDTDPPAMQPPMAANHH